MFDKVKQYIDLGRNIFITGGGGVGKSYMLNQLTEEYPDIVVTSTTGISAINIGGTTIHSWAGVNICKDPIETQKYKVLNKFDKYNEILNTTRLAIDEISMLSPEHLKYISDFLSVIRADGRPFGGLQVILIGDFFQLPPVNPQNINSYCFTSPVWKDLDLVNIVLTKVYRQKDKQLVNALNNIRKGVTTDHDINLFESRNDVEPTEECVRLYATNLEASKYNTMKLAEIDDEEKTYTAYDSISTIARSDIPYSKLTPIQRSNYEKFRTACKFETVLKLKVGCRVMLLYNLDLDQELVNGSTGYVTNLQDRVITVKFDNGVIEDIKRMTLPETPAGGGLFVERKQFPLKLAYAVTVHKSQGQTYNKVYADLDRTFADGQAYVALSRCTSLDGLFLKGFSRNKIKANKQVIDFYSSLNDEKIIDNSV